MFQNYETLRFKDAVEPCINDDCEKMMLKNVFLILFYGVPLLVVPQAFSEEDQPTKECRAFWTPIRELNEQYEKKHDLTAGKKLLERLPKAKVKTPDGCPPQRTANESLYSDSKFREAQIKAGNPIAMQIAFRLMNIADGDFAENLDIDLGQSIEKHPKKFLQYLKAEHGEGFCSDGLIGNTGIYDEDHAREKKTLTSRMNALLKVKDGNLQKVLQVCVARLKLQISKL